MIILGFLHGCEGSLHIIRTGPALQMLRSDPGALPPRCPRLRADPIHATPRPAGLAVLAERRAGRADSAGGFPADAFHFCPPYGQPVWTQIKMQAGDARESSAGGKGCSEKRWHE